MQFNKYNSIENTYQTEMLDKIIAEGYGDMDFVVQEKVHGANLSFITNGEAILSAKRTDLLEENKNFFNEKSVKEKYQDKIFNLFNELAKTHNVKTLTIFGEIFGGGYPHNNIPKNDKAQLVQRGIYYHPSNDFFAFDILIDNDTYLDVNLANQLFEKFGFVYAKTLFQGKLQDCLTYPNTFKTTIPTLYDLPEIEGNLCEGVVIRPVQPSFLKSGSRILLKNKNETWAENNNHIDKTLLRQLFSIGDEGQPLSEPAQELCEEIYPLISKNRLANVLSKIGDVNPKKDLGKVTGLYNKDVLEEFFKTHKPVYDALEKKESKAINKFLNEQASKLIYDYFAELS